jgi:hypothetical protein
MQAPSDIPGKIPAKNSLEIETPPITPNKMKPMEGGITGRNDATRRNQTRRPVHAIASISHHGHEHGGQSSGVGHGGARQAGHDQGCKNGHIAQATPESDPPIPSAELTMRRLMPPAFMSSPASMKNGTAIKGKLSAPLIKF